MGLYFLLGRFYYKGVGAYPTSSKPARQPLCQTKRQRGHLSFLASTWASVKLCHFLPNPKNGSSGPRGGSGDEVNTSEQIYLWVKRLP